MSEPIQVHSQYLTDPDDPEGPCLVMVRAWPLPQDIGQALGKFLDEEAKRFISERYPNVPWRDLTGKGPMQ